MGACMASTDSLTSRQGLGTRLTGWLFLLSALATASSALFRLAADADQPTDVQLVEAVSQNSWLYGAGGAARCLAGIALMAGAWCLLRTWIIRNRQGSPLVPGLFGVSGGFTVISGVAAVVLAIAAASEPEVTRSIESILFLRWVSGKIGFAMAGLAIGVASRFQPKMEGVRRYGSPVSAILGLAMQFIWIDSATIVHPLVGAAFFVWLVVVGGLLAAGRTKRLVGRLPEAGL